MEKIFEMMSCCEAKDQLDRELCGTVRDMLRYSNQADFALVNEYYGITNTEPKEVNCALILLRRTQENKELNKIEIDYDTDEDAHSGVSDNSNFKAIVKAETEPKDAEPMLPDIGGELLTESNLVLEDSNESSSSSPPKKKRAVMDLKKECFELPEWLSEEAKDCLRYPMALSVNKLLNSIHSGVLRFVALWNRTINCNNSDDHNIIAARVRLHILMIGSVGNAVTVVSDRTDVYAFEEELKRRSGYLAASPYIPLEFGLFGNSSSSEDNISKFPESKDEFLGKQEKPERPLTELEKKFLFRPETQLMHESGALVSTDGKALIQFCGVSVKKLVIDKISVNKTKPNKVIAILLEDIYKNEALEICTVGGTNRGPIGFEKLNRVKLAPAGIDAILEILKLLKTKSDQSEGSSALKTGKSEDSKDVQLAWKQSLTKVQVEHKVGRLLYDYSQRAKMETKVSSGLPADNQ